MFIANLSLVCITFGIHYVIIMSLFHTYVHMYIHVDICIPNYVAYMCTYIYMWIYDIID